MQIFHTIVKLKNCKQTIVRLGTICLTLNILFSDTQAGTLPTSIVSHLKEHIYAHAPQHRNNPIIPIYLTYWIMGSYYACMANSNQLDYRQVLKILEDIQPAPPKLD